VAFGLPLFLTFSVNLMRVEVDPMSRTKIRSI